MIKVEFEKPLTALEVRDPVIEACEEVAASLGIYAKFHQPQQQVWSERTNHPNRRRIGNGKHKNWFIDYQTEEPSANRPTVLGRVNLASAILPQIMQFGGFDYGESYAPHIPTPTYRFITVDVPRLPEEWPPIMPTAEMVELTYEKVQERFAH